MRRHRNIVTALKLFTAGLLLAVLNAGCYPKASIAPQPAEDPETLVRRVLMGMSELQAEVVMTALMGARRYHQDLVHTFVELRQEIRLFIQTFEEVYGADTWADFQESGIDGLKIRFGGWEDDGTFEFDENLLVLEGRRYAYYSFPNVRNPTVLKRTASGWLVDTPTLLGTRRETFEVRLWMTFWMEILRQARSSMKDEKPDAAELYRRTAHRINRDLFGRRDDLEREREKEGVLE